ncbi:MAG: histidine kinase [Flavobacteriaceae bacterium]
MDSSTFIEILNHPNENGIVEFVLGLLFVLSIYHFLLYFQHKDKSSLLYSIYTGLIFLGHLTDVKTGFIPILIEPIASSLRETNLDITWLYNMLYFIFAFTFLELKSYSIKWHHFIFKSIYLLFFISVVFEITYRVTGDVQTIRFGHSFFLSYLSIVGLISYIPLFKMDNPLRFYIIIGSTFLFSSSLTATFLYEKGIINEGSEINFSIFYIGVILENILFSLGLGHKQKIILKEKNESQTELIEQLQENETLRSKIQEQLEADVNTLNKNAEEKKLETLKAKYDKELSDLKMASLRNQMNPHFIFNSLNSIKLYIINNEKENAVYYLNKFSKLIRKILATTREKEVSLADEIETTELYLNIENIRFHNEIEFNISIDKSLPIDTLKIPGLILQPFIENAIWHGLSSKKGTKKIQINVEEYQQTHIKITIHDNGIGRKKSAEIKQNKIHKKDSLGIKINEERLENFAKDYKNNYSLEFVDLYENDMAIGTEVVLKIPTK